VPGRKIHSAVYPMPPATVIRAGKVHRIRPVAASTAVVARLSESSTTSPLRCTMIDPKMLCAGSCPRVIGTWTVHRRRAGCAISQAVTARSRPVEVTVYSRPPTSWIGLTASFASIAPR
jgi:hypothetical protein